MQWEKVLAVLSSSSSWRFPHSCGSYRLPASSFSTNSCPGKSTPNPLLHIHGSPLKKTSSFPRSASIYPPPMCFKPSCHFFRCGFPLFLRTSAEPNWVKTSFILSEMGTTPTLSFFLLVSSFPNVPVAISQSHLFILFYAAQQHLLLPGCSK